jgi:hypothetical protein
MLASYPVWRSGETPFFFRMVSTADDVTPMTGLAPTLQVARDTAGLAGTTAPVIEVGDGWYKATNPSSGVVSAATHLYGSSLPYGPYLLVATAAGARGSGLYYVVATDPEVEIKRNVLGENMSDMKATYGDESLAQALHNAFNWNKSGDPDAPSGVRLAPAGLDQIEVEEGVNARQALSPIGAVMAGRSSGLATASATYYAMGASGTTGTSIPRVVAAVDASGNRGTVTLTLPD